MNFIKSQNCPIFANFLSENTAPSTGNQFFAATSATLSFDAQLEANKTFGSLRAPDDYTISGPQVGKLNLEAYPMVGSNSVADTDNQLTLITGLAKDFVSGHQILMGNLLLKRCYLSALNIQISPQEPVVIKSTFDVYDLSSVTGISFTGANISNVLTTNGSGAYLESLHALAMGISGSGVNMPQSRTEIDISLTCSRTPNYGLGSIYPSTVILDNVSRRTSLKGADVGQIVNFSGANGIVNLNFSPFSNFITGGTGFNSQGGLFSIGITGKVNSQALNVSPDAGVGGTIQLVENLY